MSDFWWVFEERQDEESSLWLPLLEKHLSFHDLCLQSEWNEKRMAMSHLAVS